MIVSGFSAGISSFVATYLIRDKVDEIIYTHVDDQHSDTMRFVGDCEKILGKKVTILQSPYKSVENVIRATGLIKRIKYAPCTDYLKKRPRKEWEYGKSDLTYVWGYDSDEKHRAERIVEAMPNYKHIFPLIENDITKDVAHGIAWKLGLKRPKMYDLGYNNNNCIGCIKGGMGYWNKIRVDFPEAFDCRAKLEREIGHSCLKEYVNGECLQLFLDELDPNRGNMGDEIIPECGIACQLGYE